MVGRYQFCFKVPTITYSPSLLFAEYIGQNIGEHSGTTGGQTTTLALPAVLKQEIM